MSQSSLSYIGSPVEESNPLRINNKNGETIFKIDNEGIIYYLKDGKLKSFENEKELSQIFVQVISGMTGLGFQNRDEIIQRIIKNYRNGKIENLLGE
jgi:hypothetical protein